MKKNEKTREIISAQVAAYLENGGHIKHVDHTANKSWGEPARRTRKEQIQYQRKMGAYSSTENNNKG